MYRYRPAFFIPVAEVVPLQHARNGVLRHKAYHVGGGKPLHPFAVEYHLGLLLVEYLEYLSGIGAGVGGDLFLGERLARLALARRVAYHAGEVAYEKKHMVPELLKVPELLYQHRVPQMEVGGCGVEARLDAKRPPLCRADGELLEKLSLAYDAGRAPFNYLKLFFRVHFFNTQSSASEGYGPLRPLRSLRATGTLNRQTGSLSLSIFIARPVKASTVTTAP